MTQQLNPSICYSSTSWEFLTRTRLIAVYKSVMLNKEEVTVSQVEKNRKNSYNKVGIN